MVQEASLRRCFFLVRSYGQGVVIEVGQMIQTIIDEMSRGNFSFLILVVGIAQLIVMVRNGRKGNMQNNTVSPKPGEKGVADEI